MDGSPVLEGCKLRIEEAHALPVAPTHDPVPLGRAISLFAQTEPASATNGAELAGG